MGVGGRHVQGQAGALSGGGQRRDEAALEVAVEALTQGEIVAYMRL